MKTLKFKTNIKCSGCEATVTPFLDGSEKVQDWNVDTTNPQKVLTVETEASVEEIQEIVKRAGFTAEKLEEQK